MIRDKSSDPLDMNNYRIENLPNRPKSNFERWMSIVGGPLAVIVFITIYWLANIPYLNDISDEFLKGGAINRKYTLGLEEFSRINYAMLAIFAAAFPMTGLFHPHSPHTQYFPKLFNQLSCLKIKY